MKTRAAVAIAVGLVALAAPIGFGLVQQASYQQEGERQAADYAKYAADQLRWTCAEIAASQRPACIRKAVGEYRLKARDSKREQADLAVQRQVALWTSIMGIAALIGMALSVTGVLLVWMTFTNQREANAQARLAAAGASEDTLKALAIAEKNADAAFQQVDHAKRASRWQLRSYVGVLTAWYDWSGSKPLIALKVAAFGETPARLQQFDIKVHWIPRKGEPIELLSSERSFPLMCFKGHPYQVPFSVNTGPIDGAVLGRIAIIGLVVHQDIFGDLHKDAFAFSSDNVYFNEVSDRLDLKAEPVDGLITSYPNRFEQLV